MHGMDVNCFYAIWLQIWQVFVIFLLIKTLQKITNCFFNDMALKQNKRLLRLSVSLSHVLLLYALECPNSPKQWGRNCENYCRCKSENCDKATGCTSCDEYPGWTGPNCDEDIDECQDIMQYCGANSDCTNTKGTFICHCHSWYYRVSGRQNRCERKWPTYLPYIFASTEFLSSIYDGFVNAVGIRAKIKIKENGNRN